MPKFTKKKKNAPTLSPGFTQSRAAYKQVHAHPSKHLGKHPHFDYNMTELHPDHTLSLLHDDKMHVMALCTVNPSLRVASRGRGSTGSDAYFQIGIRVMEVIDEAQRGKGLGRRMLGQVVATAREGGDKCVRTFAIDGAAEFYRKYGVVRGLAMMEHETNVRFDL
jgi:GNAT superfamily N-acetyltransferase